MRHREEEEPEWFSSGPTSQADTIELRGFEEPKREQRQPRQQHQEPAEQEKREVAEYEQQEQSPDTQTEQREQTAGNSE